MEKKTCYFCNMVSDHQGGGLILSACLYKYMLRIASMGGEIFNTSVGPIFCGFFFNWRTRIVVQPP